MSTVYGVTTGHHVSAKVHELRADAVKVRRPRVSGVGAKRRTLHGVEHSATLEPVMAGQHVSAHNGHQIQRVTWATSGP